MDSTKTKKNHYSTILTALCDALEMRLKERAGVQGRLAGAAGGGGGEAGGGIKKRI